jgi:hypothetical protein
MAFERLDTDKLYDAVIAPTLRQENITPVRIDRIEHNEDINKRFIEELLKCDLAVADLTYARPSVYFEAGFAQRVVPVIYTCRRDHFRPRVGDEHGNFRVHFDLQMKNIIAWLSPTDRNFARRLSRRLLSTIRPLLRTRKTQEEQAQAVEAFRRLSLLEKRKRVLELAISELKRAGFKGKQPDHPWANWAGVKLQGDLAQLAAILVLPGVSKRALTDAIMWRTLSWLTDFREKLSALRSQKIRRAVEDFFLCALERIPSARASAAFPQFAFNSDMKTYERKEELVLEIGVAIPTLVRLHFFDGINSDPRLRAELRNRLMKTAVRFFPTYRRKR